MKVHRAWLQKYFDSPLPETAVLADRLTFRAFEIEEVVGDMLDVKVLPDRAAYALSHRGIAYELSAILGMPLKVDPLREALPEFPTTDALRIVTDPAYVIRHTGALIRGVKVGPSPAWLREALESVGQRSINNVVDALNYVLLDIGQPSGAFDLSTLKPDGGVTKIEVRRAKSGEKITVLTGEEYTLTDSMFVFTDAVGGGLLDIAGIKGGLASGVTEKTTDLFLSVGTYDPVLIRRSAQTLKLFTDASQRYQNGPSPELTAYGMRALLKLIPEVAGGTVVGVVDEYRTKRENVPVTVSKDEVVERLGREVSNDDIETVLERLKLTVTRSGDTFTVVAPFERSDVAIPEDVIEEVGRIIGYENLESKLFPETKQSVDQHKYHGIERIKDVLLGEGYIEISTQSFAAQGEVRLANPLDVDNPFLRPALAANMLKALENARYAAPLVIGPKDKLKLFEVGTVFGKDTEHLSLVVSERSPALDALISSEPHMTGAIAEYDLSRVPLESLGEAYSPVRYSSSAFTQFSTYPFVLRDIALWTTNAVAQAVAAVLSAEGTDLLVKTDLFDTFSKESRTSYAFRLVFQSMERTLTDDEVNAIMARITAALIEKGWEVR